MKRKRQLIIIILQNDKGIKWNISYVTQRFNNKYKNRW